MVKRVIQFVNEINQNKYVTQNFDNYQRVMSKDLFYSNCNLATLMMFMEKIKRKGSAIQNLIQLYKTLL